MKKLTLAILVFALLTACAPRNVEVPVTVIAKETVEVTRPVEVTKLVEVTQLVEVTRVVEVTPVPTATPPATSTPRATRTPQPTATPSFGTMGAPIPLGTAESLFNTSGSQRSDWTLLVEEVIRGDEANKIVRYANSFNDKPPAGASYILVKVKVTLDKGAAFTLDDSDLAVISGGQIFAGSQFGVCCTDDNGYALLDANIALPGTSIEGWVIRPVLLNDEKPLLAINIDSYRPNLDDGIFFALYK